MRIFFDANILFSAAKSEGAVRAFLSQLRTDGHTLVVDAYVVGEAKPSPGIQRGLSDLPNM
jgi:hypothetical protein